MPIEIDGFEVESEIGRGGFGVVYRARQLAFNRLVAIKVLHPGLSDEKLRKQFASECRAVGALRRHRNILGVYSTGVTGDGRPYLAMELLSDRTLTQRIPLPVEQVRELGIRLADALEVAHEGGVIHRDVKPSNVLFDADGEPVLVDFGISSLVTDPSTTTSSIAVSIGYTAPEVLDGAKPAVAADVYALGATLFAATTGRTPFVVEGGFSSIAVLAARILTQPVEDLRPAGVPAWLCRVIETAMEKDPAARYPSMAVLRGALEAAGGEETVRITGNQWRTTDPIPAPDDGASPKPRRFRPSRRAVALIGVGVLAVAGGATAAVYGLTGSASPSTSTTARTDLDCDGVDDFLAVGATGDNDGVLLFYPRGNLRDPTSHLPTTWTAPSGAYEKKDPHFGASTFISLVLPGDLTGDGKPDLVGEKSDGSLWLMPGDCSGGFTAAARHRIVDASSQVELTAPGDFTGDGRPDLLGVDNEHRLVLYKGTEGGGVQPGTAFNNGWTSAIGVGDVDGDGAPDVLDRRADGSLRLYESDGKGGWKHRAIAVALRLPPSDFGYVIGGVDVTLGAHPDLVATDKMGMLVSFAVANGATFQASCVRVGGGWFYPQVVDIAGATRVPGVPLPAYVHPDNHVQPPVPLCATTTK